jgi:hypothetical protein
VCGTLIAIGERLDFRTALPFASLGIVDSSGVEAPSAARHSSAARRDKMILMLQRSTSRVLVPLIGFGLAVGSLSSHAQDDNSQHGRKYKAPPPAARIEVTILRDFNGKPLEDAHVIFHPLKGEKDKGNLELKTDEDGKVVIDVLPIGDTVRLQVIANGYQTYGQDYKVDKPEMSMEIRMKRPGAQYSIYKDSSGAPKSNNNSGPGSSGTDKSAPPSQNSVPPASGNKPSGSAQPNASQPQSN